jgi:hypothetical protein
MDARVCPNRITWPKVCGGNFGHLTDSPTAAVGWAPPTNTWSGTFRWAVPTLLSFAQRISPHLGRILSPPRGEIQTISPHCHITTANQQRTCAGMVRRYSPNFASPKKEKIFSEAKIMSLSSHSILGVLRVLAVQLRAVALERPAVSVRS